jgi:superfamily I DNA/RNA helicase
MSPVNFSEYANINEEQRKVIESDAGAILVVAGPGTGKTHTLTYRIAHQILRKGISADTILALTFTNKAAEEMRSRLIGILGNTCQMPFIATFHGLCLTLLRELNPGNAFSVIDEEEQSELIAEAAVRAARSGIQVTQKTNMLQTWIMRAKQNVLSPDEASRANLNAPEDEGLAAVYRVYQQLLESQQVYDYEELIYRVVMRLESDPVFCRLCRERFLHVFVDEYQDLNHGQYRLIRAFMPTNAIGRQLGVIGDPDQSIYGFRGSDCAYFHRFVEDYPGSAVLALTRNYRSSDTILSASYQVINTDRTEQARVYSTIEGFKSISVLELPNEHAEAETIARIVENMIGGTGFHSIDTGRVQEACPSRALSYSDFAVLTRTNDQIRLISDRFNQAGIPCQTVARRHACKHEGLSQLLALLKVTAGIGSYADFERIAGIVTPHISKKVVKTFQEWCLTNRFSIKEGLATGTRFPIPGLARHQQLKLTEFARRISGIRNETASMDAGQKLVYLSRHPFIFPLIDNEESQESLNRLAAMADSGVDDVVFLERLALKRDADFYHPRAEKVALMTIHAVKGLEFTIVFVAGCEDDLIPFRRFKTDTPDLAEERRLFYVAMTRAKERLYLTYAKRRRIFGKMLRREPSPFLENIEDRLKKNERFGGRFKKKKPDQLQLF